MLVSFILSADDDDDVDVIVVGSDDGGCEYSFGLASKMLCGLISRCTMRCVCRWANPCAIYGNMDDVNAIVFIYN